MSTDLYHLRPEPKADEARAQVAQAMDIVARVLTSPCSTPDEIEAVATQIDLQRIFLRGAAKALRECEEERRRLAAWHAAEERRFEWVPMDDTPTRDVASEQNVLLEEVRRA